MSDELPAVAASPDTVLIAGKAYRITPLTLADFAEMARHVVAMLANPIEALSGQLKYFTAEERRELMATALDSARKPSENASIQQIAEFSRTWDGFCFTIWLMLRRNHPEVSSAEKAGEILADLDDAGIAALMQRVEDLSAAAAKTAKNSEGPVQITETDPHESRGLGSISS